jgi:hypothetical protein
VPAADITPGVRWQRPEGFFTDDPKVEQEYAELCARGEITLTGTRRDNSPTPWARRTHSSGALTRALVRRAAQDGYSAEMICPRGSEKWLIKLVGPLSPESAADPLPGWRTKAADSYTSLRQGGGLVLRGGLFFNDSPLIPTTQGGFIERELRALAARDGYELYSDEGWKLDGMGCIFELRDAEGNPVATEAASAG